MQHSNLEIFRMNGGLTGLTSLTTWWIKLAERIQHCADTGEFRGFYEALKAVYGPSLSDKEPLMKCRWQRAAGHRK